MPYFITVDMLLLFYSIDGLKITSNLFLAILLRSPPFLLLRFSHNTQKSENIRFMRFASLLEGKVLNL